jgi:hypothetical protein
MKLISMKDFVLQQLNDDRPHISDQFEWDLFNHCFVARVENYANFLNQPLTLGMFVPCDEEGSVLSEPKLKDFEHFEYAGDKLEVALNKYQQAKDRVLFEINSFSATLFIMHKWIDNYDTISDLAYHNGDGITLTESAKKEIGL